MSEQAKVSGAKACSCERGPEWSGSPNPANPDNEWICDECGSGIPAEDCAHCDGTTPCIHCGSDPLPAESSTGERSNG